MFRPRMHGTFIYYPSFLQHGMVNAHLTCMEQSALAHTPDQSTATRQNVLVVAARIDRGKSDYLKLVNYLRARQRDLHTGTYPTDRVFVGLGEDSPLYSIVASFSALLARVKVFIQAAMDETHPASAVAQRFLPDISVENLRTELAIVNNGRMDFSKPFICQLHIAKRVYTLNMSGLSNSSRTVTCTLSDTFLRFIQLTEKLDRIALHLHEAAVNAELLIREDNTLSLQCLLAYYGVIIPQKASRADLAKAVTDLLPKESSAPHIPNQLALPFTIAEQPRFVLNTSQVYSFRQRSVEEAGTDDYKVIEQEIRGESQWHLGRYRNLLDRYKHFGASLDKNEKALLQLLQQAGGITLKLVVYDSDGEDDIYREQHTVNPWSAESLSQYFTKSQEELSAYMINTIKYREGEGAINIEKLVVEMIVPNVVLRSHELRTLDIEAFDIRSKEPPFLYLDPLSKGGYETINERFAAITNELREGNWDIARGRALKAAAQYLFNHYQQDQPSQPPVTYLHCLNEAANIYYSVIAKNLETQQQLKVILQPTQPEFVARAICRYLDLEEFNWGVIAQATFDIRYEASWKNTGTLVRFAKSAGYRTLLSVVYDEDLRREIGLADNFDELLQQLAQAITNTCKYTGDTTSLKTKLTGLFDANIAFVQNGDLPDDLTKPKEALARQVEAYTLKATDEFRGLEAERILLTSGEAALRLSRIDLGNPPSTDKAVYCIELLTASENDLLETRVNAFAAFLRARANKDEIQDMATSAQHVLHVVHQVAGLIPVLGNFINLGFDLYSGDAEAIVLDGMNIFAELLLRCRSLPPRVLGALMLQGTNVWMMNQQVAALKAAIKANDYPGSVTQFGFLLMGMHSALHCGIGVIHGLSNATSAEPSNSVLLLDEGRESSSGPGYETEGAVGAPMTTAATSAHSPFWAVTADGYIAERPVGRKISSLDWNGNAIVEGGARGILLGGINEKHYMLNGLAHRTVMGLNGPELRPLHTLDLEAGQWRKPAQGAGSATQFSRTHTEAFPTAFSGRPERPQAPANAVSWYDNCVATLDEVSTEATDLQGSTTRKNMAIGVIEQKYVTERDGHIELLEHAGNLGGKTRFIRADGSEVQVSATLPVMPTFKPEIQARIIAAKGMFVTVEIRETLEGLIGKKTVAGVLATKASGGGQELVIEADRGVHYRGALAAGDALALVPGETSTDQQPIELKLSKINPQADPKRASPQLYLQPDYRDSVAHDDFALELFYGAKAANEAYARNPQWVTDNITAVSKIKAQLPTSITTVDNPFYVLDTRPEHAILFAPRNQAALANTLLGKTIEWGAASSARAVALGENVLRQVGPGKPLLTSSEAIAPLAADRIALVRQLKQALGHNDLLLAEVQTRSGAKVYFAHSPAEQLRVTAAASRDELHLSHSGSIIDCIEAHYPDPSVIKDIVVLSVAEVCEADSRRIFVSSQRGYTYQSVTSLEIPQAEPQLIGPQLQLHISDDQYAERARHITIPSDSVDVSSATFVDAGPRRGSFSVNGRDYVKLDNGKLYRAHWDNSHSVFVLVPPEGKLLGSLWSYPWVRYVGGREFTLINRPGLKGGNWEARAVDSIRTRNYERSTVATGRLTSAQLRNSAELQVHHEDVHLFDDGTALQNGKLNVPSKLFGSSRVNRSGFVTLKSMIEVPQSCISSTELLVSRYAGGTSEFDYAGERLGNATALVPNVEVVALDDDQEVTLNISTTELDEWVGKDGHSDYFSDTGSFPEMGEGIGFIERNGVTGAKSSEYEFHFMFITGKILDQNGVTTAVLATDLSEPSRAHKTPTPELPRSRNWNTHIYRSIAEMRGVAGPDVNAYPSDQYYSVLVRAVNEG
ncbi:Uncharacterised protein [Paucimonas lemoignei]|nr:Uncharacterised protein [Paucimonas lemoignei]